MTRSLETEQSVTSEWLSENDKKYVNRLASCIPKPASTFFGKKMNIENQ